jgi:hypothetical protein
MTRTKRIILMAGLALAPVAILAVYLMSLPNTPQGWFTYSTGFEYPGNAVVVEDSRSYTTGMWETFASEGTSVFAFRTDSQTIQRWLAGPPPWQKSWTRGEVPIWVNENRPPSREFSTTMRGDMGNGDLLAIDPTANTVWLFNWNW